MNGAGGWGWGGTSGAHLAAHAVADAVGLLVPVVPRLRHRRAPHGRNAPHPPERTNPKTRRPTGGGGREPARRKSPREEAAAAREEQLQWRGRSPGAERAPAVGAFPAPVPRSRWLFAGPRGRGPVLALAGLGGPGGD